MMVDLWVIRGHTTPAYPHWSGSAWIGPEVKTPSYAHNRVKLACYFAKKHRPGTHQHPPGRSLGLMTQHNFPLGFPRPSGARKADF